MSGPPRAYLEHVAVRVRDIGWHIGFFEALFGWTVRQVDGDSASPRQVWIGGLQLMAAPAFDGAEGRVNHLGVRCENVEAAIAIARGFAGVTALEKGPNWLVLPEGLIVELLPASDAAVAAAVRIHPQM
ncbi:MAG: VOC family protein [Rhizobiales bacterium]|nr:VOC family protein [Hyphomicrobiales bacterium]